MTILSLARFTETLRCFKILLNASISVISGTLQIVTGSLAKIAAGIRATALFLAPPIRTVPDNVWPPWMVSVFIFTSRVCIHYILLFLPCI